MRKLVVSAVVAGSMVAGGAAGVMLGIPAISHAEDSTVTAGAQPAAATATAAADPAAAPKPGGPLADAIDSALKGLVDNKTLTQAQSDAVKAAIKDKIASLPRRGPGGPGGPRGFGFGARADVLGVADYGVIAKLLIPKYAGWYATFARNAMVLIYTDHSAGAKEINGQNWWQVLLRPDVRLRTLAVFRF